MVHRKIGFYSYLAHSYFAQALAQLKHGRWPRNGWELLACYRLGLYAEVARSTWHGHHLPGSMAQAVSLAACGQFEATHAVVQRLMARHGPGRHVAELADNLAPFMPELALQLIEHQPAPELLRAGLLLRLEKRDEAAQVLQKALAAGHAADKPELHLLATNGLGGDPATQLERINAFLNAFALSPVRLMDPARAPSALNLAAATELPPVDGPLVSVLMTAYDTADRIGAALRGLLDQTYRNIEVLVVDDCSTDGTPAVVRAFAAQDARVKYLRLPCNVGTYVAKTVGLQHAQGEFATCHDSDDWSHPQRIARQVAPLLANKRLVVTTSHWVRMEDDGRFYARPVHPLMRMNPASPLFRRQPVQDKAGLWDTVRTGADSEFHARLRLVFGRQAVHRVVQPLALGAHRPHSLMTAQDTGYSATGMAPKRLAYWEAWTHWHIAELHAGRKPVLAPMGSGTARPFGTADNAPVPAQDIARCLAETRVG